MVLNIRLAQPGDEAAIARVHVESWRSTYQGIVPDEVLAGLSVERREQYWGQLLRKPEPQQFILVAADDEDQVVLQEVGYGWSDISQLR